LGWKPVFLTIFVGCVLFCETTNSQRERVSMTSHRFTSSLLMLAICSAPAIASTDLDAISEAGELIFKNHETKSDAATASYKKTITALVLDNARTLATQEGILAAGQFDTDAFAGHIKDLVGPLVRSAAEKSSSHDRKSELYKVLRIVSTQRFAENSLSSWLHLPLPDAKAAGLGPRANTQVKLQSSDGRLKLFLDEEARIVDVGGPGTRNGVADAGEWLKLGFGVYNASATPFVSSSAWISTSGGCSWVPQDEEIELPELSPADPKADSEKQPEQMGEFESWIYISKDCAHNSVVPLSIRIEDTHNTGKTPIVLTANIRVTNRGKSRVLDYLVDSDVPGSSEGADGRIIVPDLKLEFSHGLNTGPGIVVGAEMNWSMAKESRSLLASSSFRKNEPMVLNGSSLAFGDDLDIETQSTATLHKAIDAVSKAWGWDSVDDARFWLTTDTVVQYISPDPPGAEEKEAPPEICDNYLDDDSDGKHDCQDSDCEEADVCQPPAKAISIGQVFDLVQQHTEIVASPAKANLDDAISAVDPNYELLLDRASFQTQYGCLVNRLPVSECGEEDTHKRCTDTLDNDSDGKVDCEDSSCAAICKLIEEVAKKEAEEKEAEPEPAPTNNRRNAAVVYSYRHFFTLPIQPPPEIGPEACFDGWDNDLDGNADCDDSDCSELCQKHENDYAEFGQDSCRNGTDDDFDRKVDCDDPDCADDAYCHDEVDYAFHGEESCQDGVDNDLRNDGIDCDDRDGCRGAPECARPTEWRVDLGAEINPLTVSDKPTLPLIWDRGPTLAGLFVRPTFSWGGRGESDTRMTVFASLSSHPEMSAINESKGTVGAQSYGVGFAYQMALTDWLNFEPSMMIGKRTLSIKTDSQALEDGGGAGLNLSSTGTLVQPGLTLRSMSIQAGPVGISGFLEAAFSEPTVIETGGDIVASTGFFAVRAGLGLHF
jgi:hypothetical protein